MSEPDWQPTARRRWRKVEETDGAPCATNYEYGEKVWFVLEQLWIKRGDGDTFTTKMGQAVDFCTDSEWRPVPVEDV